MATNRISHQLAHTINLLSEAVDRLCQQGCYQEAIAHVNQIREMIRVNLGENDPHYATSLNNLAELYHTMVTMTPPCPCTATRGDLPQCAGREPP